MKNNYIRVEMHLSIKTVISV